MANSNLAYDISRYEYAEAEVQAEKPRRIKLRRKNVQEGSAVKVFTASVMLCMLLCCVLYGHVETTGLYAQISAEQTNIDTLMSENVRMRSEIEGKTSLKNIEYCAEEVLGLQKLDSSQKEYISLENGSTVEIPDSSDNIFVQIRNKFYEIVEYLKG